MGGARGLRHAILPLSLFCAVLLDRAWASLDPSDFNAVLPYDQVSLPSDQFPMQLGMQTYRYRDSYAPA